MILRCSIKFGQITRNSEDVNGIILQKSNGFLLLIPIDRYLHEPDRMSKILFEKLELTETKGIPSNDKAELWKEVPKDLIPKDELNELSTFEF